MRRTTQLMTGILVVAVTAGANGHRARACTPGQDSPQQLVVSTKVENGRMSRPAPPMRQVYDPATKG